MHESQATIQLQHTCMFYYPILTMHYDPFIATDMVICITTVQKVADIAKQSKEGVNKL